MKKPEIVLVLVLLASACLYAKIASNTITASQIAAGTITANEIAAGTITATQIATHTLTANEIAANTIDASRLNVSSLSAITADLGTVTSGNISGATITGGTLTIASGGNSFTVDVNGIMDVVSATIGNGEVHNLYTTVSVQFANLAGGGNRLLCVNNLGNVYASSGSC